MKLGSLVVEDVGFGIGVVEIWVCCVVEERMVRDFVMDGYSFDVVVVMF